MRAISLEGKSMDEYLRKIKGYVNELADVGVSVRHEEYIDALLEGLPSDYVPVIESKKHTPSIESGAPQIDCLALFVHPPPLNLIRSSIN